MRRINMIKLDPNLCKGCNICMEFCPKQVYEQSKTLDRKGVHIPIPKNQDKCSKCDLCALMCPDQAIKVEEDDEQ